MNKKVMIILLSICIIVLAVIGVLYIIKDEEYKAGKDLNNINKPIQTEGITVVPTMGDEINQNTIWCGTFQLIWNDLKENLAKQDIVFTPQIDVVKNLNKGEFNTSMLSDDYYYKKYGQISIELKQEIENAIKEKFNETSDILNDFNWEAKEGYFLYAMLKRTFEFEKVFDELNKGSFANKYNDISYFGIEDSTDNTVGEQIDILYYNSKEDFALIINTKQNDEVIFVKTKEGITFDEIYNTMNDKKEQFKGDTNFTDIDIIKIPNIKLNEKKEFLDLEGKPFYFSSGEEYYIDKAIQTIEFELDKKGGKIKSEAGMSVLKFSNITGEKREFLLNDTFTIFLREKYKEKPYFAARIDDITKFQ